MSSNYPTSANTNTSNSTSDRLSLFLATIPLITKLLLFINIAIYIIIFLFSFSIGNYAISAEFVIYQQEFYRIVTSAFVHVGLLHIGMNMSTLFQLGPDLEKQFGSLQLLFMTTWSIFLTGIIYVFISWSLFRILNSPSQLYTSGVGYSGILFTYAVIESFHTTETSRSLFGMCNVPARVYPFILLILLSVFIPGISFLGHLSGCLVGLLTVTGFNVFLPSQGFLQAIESMSCMNSIARSSSYITCTSYSLTHSSFSFGDVCNCTTLKSSCIYSYTVLRNLFETLYHVINCPAIGKAIKSTFASRFSSGSSSSSSGSSNNSSGGNRFGVNNNNNTINNRQNTSATIASDDTDTDLELQSSFSHSNSSIIHNPLQLGISSNYNTAGIIGTRGSYQPLKTTDNDSLSGIDDTNNLNKSNNNKTTNDTIII